MIVICAWCQRILGVKAPEEDLSVSHGICRACSERAVPLDIDTGNVARAQRPPHDPLLASHPAERSPRASREH